MTAYTPQRSALYVPASNQRAIDKTSGIDADWIVFDLEDSVSVEQKQFARDALLQAFKSRDFGSSSAAIRCNATGSEFFEQDIETICACKPDAVLIPKVTSATDVDKFCQCAESIGLSANTDCWFMIETAGGIVNLADTLNKAANIKWPLTTLVVGHNDIASETSVSLDEERRYMIPWLMQIILYAKAHDLQVLDSVWNNFRDLEGFEKEAAQAKRMGFDGKTLIHPSQVEPATKLFSPSQEEVTQARLIVEAFRRPENRQNNVLNIDGEMVERLHLLQAERLIMKAGLKT